MQEGAWSAFRKRLQCEPDSYIVIDGDMLNNSTRSGVSNPFDETMRPREQKVWLCEQLKGIEDKILAVTGGNHEARSGKDADDAPLYDVCCKLGIEDRYRENAVFMIIRFGDKNGNGAKNPTYTACITHSTGGGIFTGAAVNRNERFGMMIDGLDLLITAHVHKGIVTRPQKLVFDAKNKKVSYKEFVAVSCTSWLEYGGYALRKMLNPASNRLQSVTLHREEKWAEVAW